MTSLNDTGTKLFSLSIPGRLPSWNQVLALEHWGRAKLKEGIQTAFLSALRLSASDSLTRTTSAKNSMLIAADTLESYRGMLRAKRKSKRGNRR